MTDVDDYVNRFIGTWNEPDADRRAHVLTEFFARDARYCNASEEFLGLERCIEAVGQAHDHFVADGFEFAPLAAPVGHHDAVTFCWQMRAKGHEGEGPAATGRMFALRGETGQIRLLYQFLDPQPTPT